MSEPERARVPIDFDAMANEYCRIVALDLHAFARVRVIYEVDPEANYLQAVVHVMGKLFGARETLEFVAECGRRALIT